jgi:hypothetical protein
MLSFIKRMIVGNTMLRMTSQSQYKKILKQQRYFFVFTGQKTSEKFQIILKSSSRFKRALFFRISNPKLNKKLKFEDDQIYFIRSSSKKRIKYLRELSASKLERWVTMNYLSKFKFLHSASYDIMKKSSNPYMVMVVENTKHYFKYIRNFLAFSENVKVKVKFAVCDLSGKTCKKYLSRIGFSKFEKRKMPLIFVVQPSKKSSDDLIYFYTPLKENIKKKKLINLDQTNLKNYFVSIIKGNSKPANFSERIPMQMTQNQFPKIVNDTLNYFFFDGLHKHLVIFFYDSRLCVQSCDDKSAIKWLCSKNKRRIRSSKHCDSMISRFENIVMNIHRKWGADSNLVRFGHFDLGSNSFDSLKIKKKLPFVRFHKTGREEDFEDLDIGQDILTVGGNFADLMISKMKNLYKDKDLKINGIGMEVTEMDL